MVLGLSTGSLIAMAVEMELLMDLEADGDGNAGRSPSFYISSSLRAAALDRR